jgi:hypothetical protein
VRRLTAAQPAGAAPDDGAGEAFSRRRLLRRAGLVAAGAAGATLAAPGLAGRAAATNGDPVVVGGTHTGTQPTSLTASGAGPTLRLESTGTGAPLRLADLRASAPSSIDLGDLFQYSGFFYDSDGPESSYLVHDSYFSNFLGLSSPFRILDTRAAQASDQSWGRTRIVDPIGKFDSVGRLRGGQTITLRLDDIASGAQGITGNFAVTDSTTQGYITAWNTGAPRPLASLVNFASGQTIANFAIVPIGLDASDRDAISIFAQATTHVILDANGIVAPHPFVFNQEALAPASFRAADLGARAGASPRRSQRPHPAVFP